MRFTYRPLPEWPHEVSSPRREGQFRVNGRWQGDSYIEGKGRVPFDDTVGLLESEVRQLDGGEIIVGVGLEPYDIRQDGLPRANARALRHPGVEVSFDSRHGRLTYATDVFTHWQDNLRAIALGLEALRKLDRYGVSKRGQQYAGFALLTAGPGKEDLGKQLVTQYGGVTEALRALHPDTGGPEADVRGFDAVMAYRKAQGAA